MRQLWRHYYEGAVAVIFVVDSSDTERLGEAAFELEQMGSDEVEKKTHQDLVGFVDLFETRVCAIGRFWCWRTSKICLMLLVLRK